MHAALPLVGGIAPSRRVLHLDMDAFFATVELLRRPELAGKPVIIGGRGDPSRRGVVAAAAYEARKCGVRSGMPFRTARRLCPEAIYLPTDLAEYARWSQVFKRAMRKVSPLFEDRGIDEAYLDISGLAEDSETVGRSRETAFDDDVADWQVLASTLAALSARVAADLNGRGYVGRTVGIKLRFADFHPVTRDRTLAERTSDASIIRKAAFDCLRRIVLDRRVRLIGVRMTELSASDRRFETPDLYVRRSD